jgi:hypothetical protein
LPLEFGRYVRDRAGDQRGTFDRDGDGRDDRFQDPAELARLTGRLERLTVFIGVRDEVESDILSTADITHDELRAEVEWALGVIIRAAADARADRRSSRHPRHPWDSIQAPGETCWTGCSQVAVSTTCGGEAAISPQSRWLTATPELGGPATSRCQDRDEPPACNADGPISSES